MFNVGDYIVYKTNGVCQVKEIRPIDKTKKLFYIMEPIREPGLTIYSPVDNAAIARRPVMTEQEAKNMVEHIADLAILDVTSEKAREDCYKKALKSCDFNQWSRVIKTIWLRKESRKEEGKKSTAVDDYYMEAAEKLLLEELSVALNITPEEADEYIKRHI